MNTDAIVAVAEKIQGWMSIAELRWLVETAAALPEGATWLEIGAWCGRSTMAVGLALPKDATLHVVDRWRDYTPDCTLEKNAPWPWEKFKDVACTIEHFRPDVKLRTWVMDSADIGSAIEPASCDVAFIDGDHAYEVVARDCRVCDGLLKPGGLLAGHDHHLPGVTRAVGELSGKAMLFQGTHIWAVRK